MEYEIRNDDDAERCLYALMGYAEKHPSIAGRMANIVRMRLHTLKTKEEENDVIREG